MLLNSAQAPASDLPVNRRYEGSSSRPGPLLRELLGGFIFFVGRSRSDFVAVPSQAGCYNIIASCGDLFSSRFWRLS